jgi:hypothetical protein
LVDYEEQGNGSYLDYAYLKSTDLSNPESSEEEVKLNVWMLNNPDFPNVEDHLVKTVKSLETTVIAIMIDLA